MTEINAEWQGIQCRKGSKSKNNKAGKQLLGMHIESEHMGITYTCVVCRHKYKTKDTFRNHLNSAVCKLNIFYGFIV